MYNMVMCCGILIDNRTVASARGSVLGPVLYMDLYRHIVRVISSSVQFTS